MGLPPFSFAVLESAAGHWARCGKFTADAPQHCGEEKKRRFFSSIVYWLNSTIAQPEDKGNQFYKIWQNHEKSRKMPGSEGINFSIEQIYS